MTIRQKIKDVKDYIREHRLEISAACITGAFVITSVSLIKMAFNIKIENIVNKVDEDWIMLLWQNGVDYKSLVKNGKPALESITIMTNEVSK